MIDRVEAIRFVRPALTGKSQPSFIDCIDSAGKTCELLVKWVAATEGGPNALVREAVAAMLAIDLGLPSPKPFVVDLSSDFVDAIPQASGVRSLAERSVGPNFGSLKLPSGYLTFPLDQPLKKNEAQVAAEILAFDVIIANPDRRPTNPNLQWNGKEFAIFDHELAFITESVVGWKPVWEECGIQSARVDQHLFWQTLRGQSYSFERLIGAFEAVSDARLSEFRTSLPYEWTTSVNAIETIFVYIREARRNIRLAAERIAEVLR